MLRSDIEKYIKKKYKASPEYLWKRYPDYPQLLENGGGKATDCIGCGQCENVCPQHITIIENLKTVARHMRKM